METETVYKTPPFSLKVVKDDLEGYVFTGEPIRIYEVDKRKLLQQIRAINKALETILGVLQNER
jgi:hypothetical protein